MIITSRVEIAKGKLQGSNTVFMPAKDLETFAGFYVPDYNFTIIATREQEVIFGDKTINPTFMVVVLFLLWSFSYNKIKSSYHRIRSCNKNIVICYMYAFHGFFGAHKTIRHLVGCHVDSSDIFVPSTDMQRICLLLEYSIRNRAIKLNYGRAERCTSIPFSNSAIIWAAG